MHADNTSPALPPLSLTPAAGGPGVRADNAPPFPPPHPWWPVCAGRRKMSVSPVWMLLSNQMHGADGWEAIRPSYAAQGRCGGRWQLSGSEAIRPSYVAQGRCGGRREVWGAVAAVRQ